MAELPYAGIRVDEHHEYIEEVKQHYTNPVYFIEMAYRAFMTDVTALIVPESNIRLTLYTQNVDELQIATIANNLVQDMLDLQEVNMHVTYFMRDNTYDQKLSLQKIEADGKVHSLATFVGESYSEIVPKFIKTIPGLNAHVLWPVEIREQLNEPDREENVSEIIIALNDSYDWTRERIADWLDTLEVDLTIGEI